MRRRGTASAVVSFAILMAACGARSELRSVAQEDGGIAPPDSGRPLDAGHDVDSGRHRDASKDVNVDAPAAQFSCGPSLVCSSASQYCFEGIGGCLPPGATCAQSAECCTNDCADGICIAPFGDAGPPWAYSCDTMPPPCLGNPTCACVTAQEPCGVAFNVIDCVDGDPGVFVTCD